MEKYDWYDIREAFEDYVGVDTSNRVEFEEIITSLLFNNEPPYEAYVELDTIENWQFDYLIDNEREIAICWKNFLEEFYNNEPIIVYVEYV